MKRTLPLYNFLPRVSSGGMTHFPYLSDDEMGNLRWVAESYSNELPVYVPDSGHLLKGDRVRVETRYTGKTEEINTRETKNYTKTELNRSIINPSQIKLILTTYRDAVYTEVFNDPQREPNFAYLPKTLIFALMKPMQQIS